MAWQLRAELSESFRGSARAWNPENPRRVAAADRKVDELWIVHTLRAGIA